MAIDEKLWIFAYKNASESAKLLAEKLDVWLIRHEGSKFHGKAGQFILNWGAGTGVYNAATGGATVLNPPHMIDVACNKRSWFDAMTDAGGPRTVVWTTSKAQARYWLEQDYEVVARTVLEGCKGAGIKVIKPDKPLDFVAAPLYTIKVDNVVSEYRVYMFNNEVIDYRIKRGKPQDGMLVGDDVEFVIADFPPPEDVVKQAVKAANKLKLTIQGLDIIWDGRKAWVLETNTAPYLGIQTAKKYAKLLAEMVAA